MLKALLPAVLGVGLVCAGPACRAQPVPAPAGPADDMSRAPGADGEFMVGLRRVGVLAGQFVICTPEGDRPRQIEKMSLIGNVLATEFGLRAAFNFIGAAGYGSGLPMDQAACPGIVKDWQAVEQQYGGK